MKHIGTHLIGRLGNQMFQYAFARAFAEREGMVLHTNAWEGQLAFNLDDPPLEQGMEMLPEHYRQDQDSLIYTRRQAREWFTLRDWAHRALKSVPSLPCVAHLRRGDYLSCGYPVVSGHAYARAAHERGLPEPLIVSEEQPRTTPFTSHIAWLPDFIVLMRAVVLYRANSSFSWWAATLGNGRVFAPLIEGLKGGFMHDHVTFVEGNHPRLAELPGITDLHLNP